MRTRSILVPMSVWQDVQDLAQIVAVATEIGADRPAERREATALSAVLPTVDPLQGTELIEALFLEERAPIVVFDSETPEPLALRLTTALWPGFRRTFSMSTFARSPRTIGRKSFDLVFASKDARSRFADWKGRRIDGRKRGPARHLWSTPIVEQILCSPVPSLKSLDALGEMSSDGVGSESALRVSLLWADLRSKLPDSPTAALGILDIANTRKVRQVGLIWELEPELSRSVARAATTMAAKDAWKYLTAFIRKLEGLGPSKSLIKSIGTAAIDLAWRYPVATLEEFPALNEKPQKELLIGAVGEGISKSLDQDVSELICRLDSKDFLDLLFASASLAEETIAKYPASSLALAGALRTADDRVRAQAHQKLLGLLVDDFHVEPARLLVDDLDVDGLVKEAAHVHDVNGFRSAKIRSVLAERARALDADAVLRDAVTEMSACAGRDALLVATLRQTAVDVDWLLSTPALEDVQRVDLIRSQLAAASSLQLRGMLSDQRRLTRIIGLLNASNESDAELLTRIAGNVAMPDRHYVTIVVALLPTLRDGGGTDLVVKAVELALQQEPDEVSSSIVNGLLLAVGDRLNGGRALRLGLQRGVSPAAASRNLLAFRRAPHAVRRSMLDGIEEMAGALAGRHHLDISLKAAEAAAMLLWDSGSVNVNGFLRASAIILPLALDEPRVVASPLIAAAFAPVYRGLANESAFDFLSLMFVFLDWDKCKSARRHLVNAFIRSEWRVTDIAIAAVRSGDPVRIFGRMAREGSGEQALRALIADMDAVPEEIREPILAALKEIGVS